jgi:Na+/H+-dicarboxylate symporter
MTPDQPELPPRTVSKRRISRGTIIGVVAVVIILLVIGAFVWMVQAGVTGTVRDIFIIFMAIVSLFIGVMLVMLVYQIAALTKMLREEVKPLLENVQETVNTARGTTQFVSEHVVQPVIGASSAVVGVARVLSLLGDLVRPRSK